MDSIKTIRNYMAKRNRLNSQINREFKLFSHECAFREKVYYDNEEWLKCVNKDYHLSKYINITPCCIEKCPILK